MKIFFYFLREFDELAICERLAKELGVEFGWTAEYPTSENAALAAGCDAISCTPCDLGTAMVERFHQLGVKYIACRSIGYDHVDRQRAKELGMKVSNVSYPPSGVADYAIMLMLMCARRVQPILSRAAVQDYSLKGKMGRDFSTLTIGVVGTGSIGSEVVRHLSGFGCRVVAYDLYPRKDLDGLVEYLPLEQLLAQSDIISLHTNATPENYHLISDESLALCKDGVMVVNTARGKLVDSGALIRGLESGKVGAAALDVLEDENGLYYYNRIGDVIANRDMSVLRSFPNVILSPHTAFYTDVNVEYMVRGCFEAVISFAKGEPTPHDVSL